MSTLYDKIVDMVRVAVTGMGAVTPLGPTIEASWEALKAGACGTGPYAGSGFAGEAKGFRPSDYLSAKEQKRVSAFALFALAASVMALEDSGLAAPAAGASVVIGSSRGGLPRIEEASKNKRRKSAFLMPSTTIGMAPALVAKALGAEGRTLGISNSCASGAAAIGEAFCLVRNGISPIVLAGGADAPLCPLAFDGYSASGALSKTGLARPFDRKRDGFVLSEGATVIVLEDYGRAVARGARIYGEIMGYGNTSDCFHETMPRPGGQARAIKSALDDAGIAPTEIDYINAHASGTRAGDAAELLGLSMVFGKTRIPVSSFKAATGHMLGASGAFEAAGTLLALRDGIIPPTINLAEPDNPPQCAELIMEKTLRSLGTALSNTFGFGGLNAALVFRSV